MTSRSRLSAPLPARTRPLSSAQPPKLTLRPVEFSLTEGTNIPPPPPEKEKPAPVSHSPVRSPSPGPGSGPLSSHPVTPIDGVDMYAFPSLDTSRMTTTSTTNGNNFTFPPRSYTDTHSSSTLDARDDPTASHSSQQRQYQQYPPHPQAYPIPLSHPPNTWETQRSSRRPSIAQRFLSSLRSRSRSSSLQSNQSNYSRPPSRSSMMMLNSGAGPYELDSTTTASPNNSNNSRHIPRRSSRLSLTLARLTSSHPTPAPVPTVTPVDRGHADGQYSYASNGISPRELALGDSPLPSRPATGRTSMTLSGGGGGGGDNRSNSGTGLRKRSFDWFSSLPLGNSDRDKHRRRAQSATWAYDPETTPNNHNSSNAYTASTLPSGTRSGGNYTSHTHSNSTPNALTSALSPGGGIGRGMPARRPVPPPSHLHQYPQQYQHVQPAQRQGPPPPQIPSLKLDAPVLDGEALFKDIGRRGTVYHGKRSHRSFQFV